MGITIKYDGLINSEDFEKDPASVERLRDYHGIIVLVLARAVLGNYLGYYFTRENKIPCLDSRGMQLAAIDIARMFAATKRILLRLIKIPQTRLFISIRTKRKTSRTNVREEHAFGIL